MTADPSLIPVQPASFQYGLPNLARSLKSAGLVKIVALGSSTTAGEGGILAYPYRLEALFRNSYQRPMVDVLNRGVGGQEAPTEFERFEQDVIAEKPSLVIWQVGTNSVWQPPSDHPPSLIQTIDAVRSGINRLRREGGIDIVLMDPQYTPAMLTPAKIDATYAMVASLARVAGELEINLFSRFELMKGWHDVEKIPIDKMVDPGDSSRLHDSDWATQRLTQTLYDLVVANLDKSAVAI